MSDGKQICKHYRGYDEQCPHAEWLIRFYDAARELDGILEAITDLSAIYSASRARGIISEASKSIRGKWGALLTDSYIKTLATIPSDLENVFLSGDNLDTKNIHDCIMDTARLFNPVDGLRDDCRILYFSRRVYRAVLSFAVALCYTERCLHEIEASTKTFQMPFSEYGRLHLCSGLENVRITLERYVFSNLHSVYRTNPLGPILECNLLNEYSKNIPAHSRRFAFYPIPSENSFHVKPGKQHYYIRELLWDNNIVTTRVFAAISLMRNEAVDLVRILNKREVHSQREKKWEHASDKLTPKAMAIQGDALVQAYAKLDTTATFCYKEHWFDEAIEFTFGLPSDVDMTNLKSDSAANAEDFDQIENGEIYVNLQKQDDHEVLSIILAAIKRIKKRFSKVSQAVSTLPENDDPLEMPPKTNKKEMGDLGAEDQPEGTTKPKRWTKETARKALIPVMLKNPGLSLRELNKLTDIPAGTIQANPVWPPYRDAKKKGIEVTRDIFEVTADMAIATDSTTEDSAMRQESLEAVIRDQNRDMFRDQMRYSQKEV